MTKCAFCDTQILQNYCPNCGQPSKLKRIDRHYVVHEIEHLFHIDRGIFYTIRELATKPGESVRSYISKDRNRLVKPVLFIIVTSLFYTICNDIFHFEAGYINFTDDKNSTYTAIFTWFQSHYGYTNLFMGVFIALWAKLFFRKSEFNFFEILILLCFVIGMNMLLYAAFGILQGLTAWSLSQIPGVVGFLYTTWAIAQFFGTEKIVNYIKAFFAYLLGMVTFVTIALLVGVVVDIVIK